jgi:hypothetical protein
MLLNDSFVQLQAVALADRLTKEAGAQSEAQVKLGFQLVLQREPTLSEMKGARSLLSDQRQCAVAEGIAEPERAALKSFCRGLLNVNEMVYVD